MNVGELSDRHGEAAYAAEAATLERPKVAKGPCQQKASAHSAFHAQIDQNIQGCTSLAPILVAHSPRFSKPDDALTRRNTHVLLREESFGPDFSRSFLLTRLGALFDNIGHTPSAVHTPLTGYSLIILSRNCFAPRNDVVRYSLSNN